MSNFPEKPTTAQVMAQSGGIARAAKLSPERRSEIATQAARKRWGNPRELVIPITEGRCARVPFPMNADDYTLLITTLSLWKSKLISQ